MYTYQRRLRRPFERRPILRIEDHQRLFSTAVLPTQGMSGAHPVVQVDLRIDLLKCHFAFMQAARFQFRFDARLSEVLHADGLADQCKHVTRVGHEPRHERIEEIKRLHCFSQARRRFKDS